MSEEIKKRGRDPEFMARMRQLAQAKKAEQKKIREAEKLKQQHEHKTKLDEADKVFDLVKEVVTTPPKPNEEPKPASPPKEKEINYKNEYYKTKLELLKQQSNKPKVDNTTEEQFKPLPHKLLKHEFVNDINKTIMKELWKKHFGNDVTPYD